MPGPPLAVHVRLARLDDAESTRAIYNREVLGATVTFDLVARSVEDQRAWLVAHSGAHPAIVAETTADHGTGTASEVVGFASLSPYRDRPAYATTVENSVYVHHQWRGQGIGHLLLEELLELAVGHGFHAVIARIVDGHDASIALHRRCGFELVGIERQIGRKFGRWLDVALMQRLLEPGSR